MSLRGFSLTQVPRAPHLADEPLLEALCLALPDAALEEAIAAAGAREQRRRLLPARLVVALVIGMGLWARGAVRRPEEPGRRAARARPGPLAGLARAGQVGPDPGPPAARAEAPVPAVRPPGRPAAPPALPGAFLFGRRLMAVDGTVLDLPDTPENARAFGRPATGRGEPAGACPHLRLVWLVEAGTHVLCDLVLRPCRAGAAPAARHLLRSVRAGMLLMWDRGLHGFELLRGTLDRGADVLGRVGKAVVLTPEELLRDGSFLAFGSPSPTHRRKRLDGILVRVSEDAIDDPARPRRGERYRLITSLLDPLKYPAAALAAEYHQRWEVESTIDEVKVHPADRRPTPHLRSRKPREGVQEAYGLALAHLAVRLTRCAAAARAGLDPDRLRFTGTLRLLRRAVGRFQRGRPDPALAPCLSTAC